MVPTKKVLSGMRSLAVNARFMSAKAGPLVDLAVDNDGIATVTMQRPPVNSLNLDLLQELSKSLDEVAKNKCKGMVLTSSSPTVFSAGLDIMEMYKAEPKRATTFWNTLQEVWMKLYGSKYPTAAAINGHAPAGGCLLSMSCEYRTMVSGKYTIGLNETALGIVAPRWFIDTLQNTIPARDAELALTTGKLYTVDEALKVGMIDEVAANKDDAVAKSKKFIERFDNISPVARMMTKLRVRDRAIKWLKDNRQIDTDEFIGFVMSPQVQQGLEMYLAILKQKARK